VFPASDPTIPSFGSTLDMILMLHKIPQCNSEFSQFNKEKENKKRGLCFSGGVFLTSILAFSQNRFFGADGIHAELFLTSIRILYPLNDTSRAQPHQYCETNHLAWIYKQLCSVLSSQKFFLLQTGFSSYLCFDNEFLPSLVSGPPVSGEFEFILCILLG
jgi:hypothetical protein